MLQFFSTQICQKSDKDKVILNLNLGHNIVVYDH